MSLPLTSTVFLLGATGYIGGVFLDKLLTSSTPPSTITALIRSSEKIGIFEKLSSGQMKCVGVRGSMEDRELVSKLASESEVVVSAASADDTEMMKALLAGMKARYKKTGVQGVLIHVSGTGTITDDSRGMYKSTEIWTDLPSPSTNFAQAKTINTLPDKAFHRDVDLLGEAADKEGFCRVYIIVPGTIWGAGTGIPFDKGLSNPHSVQIPAAIKLSLKRGQAGVMGDGLNVWVRVHSTDVADLFGALYPQALANTADHGPIQTSNGTPSSGYYFSADYEYCLGDAMRLIGDEMYKHGWSKTSETSKLSEKELKESWGEETWIYPGTNSRAVTENPAKVLGFTAPKGLDSRVGEWEEYIRSETRRLGSEMGGT